MSSVIKKGMSWVLGQVKAEWKHRRSEEYKRMRLKWDRRLTIALVIALGAISLFAVSPLGAQFAKSQPNQNFNQSYSGAVSQFAKVADPYNKAATLKSSASAELASYPPVTGASSLSSAAIDEQTGKVSYLRGMGKGDIAVTNKSDSALDSTCSGYTIHASGGGKNSSFDIPACPSFTADGNDFITGTNGLLMQFPLEMTTQNPVVQAMLALMQGAALGFMVPIMALIGMNVLMGAATARFANGVEALSRLVPAAVGIVFVTTLVEFIFGVDKAITASMRNVVSVADIDSIIEPVTYWLGILSAFLTLSIALVIAKSIAPLLLEVLGTGATIGVFIAVPAEIAIRAVFLGILRFLIIILFDMALFVQVAMRVVLINFYIIVSPIAIVATALPGRQGQGFAREWINGFLSLVASQFAQIMVLFLGIILLNTIHTQGFAEGQLIPELVKYGILTLMMRAPGVFRSNATGLLSGLGSTAAGVVAAPYLALAMA
jgi:hypothetical protein